MYPLQPATWSASSLRARSLQKPSPACPHRICFSPPPTAPATPRPHHTCGQPQPPARRRRGLVARGLVARRLDRRAGALAAAARGGSLGAKGGLGGAGGAPGRLGPQRRGAGTRAAAREEVGEAALRHGEAGSRAAGAGRRELGGGSLAADGSGATLRADFRATRGPAPSAGGTIGVGVGGEWEMDAPRRLRAGALRLRRPRARIAALCSPRVLEVSAASVGSGLREIPRFRWTPSQYSTGKRYSVFNRKMLRYLQLKCNYSTINSNCAWQGRCARWCGCACHPAVHVT